LTPYNASIKVAVDYIHRCAVFQNSSFGDSSNSFDNIADFKHNGLIVAGVIQMSIVIFSIGNISLNPGEIKAKNDLLFSV